MRGRCPVIASGNKVAFGIMAGGTKAPVMAAIYSITGCN
jgi:hypothetical protein